MAKKLYIIRHGKSSWETVVSDFDRPLTERGVRDAYDMAGRLKEAGLMPERVYCSPATRAMHTATIMATTWELNDELFFVRRKLYLPEEQDILDVIAEVPDEVQSLALFGHNPAFTYFANRFLSPAVENIPTTGVVVLTLELNNWNDILDAKVLEGVFDYPKRTR